MDNAKVTTVNDTKAELHDCLLGISNLFEMAIGRVLELTQQLEVAQKTIAKQSTVEKPPE